MIITIEVFDQDFETIDYLEASIIQSIKEVYFDVKNKLNENLQPRSPFRYKLKKLLFKISPSLANGDLIRNTMLVMMNTKPFQWNRKSLIQHMDTKYDMSGEFVISEEYLQFIDKIKQNSPSLFKKVFDYAIDKKHWVKMFQKTLTTKFKIPMNKINIT